MQSENHNFNGGGLLWISLEWTVAPLIACLCSYIFFKLLRAFLLRSEDAEKRILIFLPIDYGISTGLLCLFVIFQVCFFFLKKYKFNIMDNKKLKVSNSLPSSRQSIMLKRTFPPRQERILSCLVAD
jgi:phosphate/sulfate permease